MTPGRGECYDLNLDVSQSLTHSWVGLGVIGSWVTMLTSELVHWRVYSLNVMLRYETRSEEVNHWVRGLEKCVFLPPALMALYLLLTTMPGAPLSCPSAMQP